MLLSDIDSVRALIEESEDFRTTLVSPIYPREEMTSAVIALGGRIGLGILMRNTLSLMASKRRLFALPALLEQLKVLIDADRGVVKAEVVSASELDPEDAERLRRVLGERVGHDVEIDFKVDESLIGGISVRLGSRLVDASVRTRLGHLKNALQEVGT